MPNVPASWQVGYYRDHRGRSPVLEYLDTLQAAERARVVFVIERLQESGIDLGMPHARPLQGRLRELRAGPIRLLYFADTDRRFVVLHAFRKTTGKTPAREMETALRRMHELQEQ